MIATLLAMCASSYGAYGATAHTSDVRKPSEVHGNIKIAARTSRYLAEKREDILYEKSFSNKTAIETSKFESLSSLRSFILNKKLMPSDLADSYLRRAQFADVKTISNTFAISINEKSQNTRYARRNCSVIRVFRSENMYVLRYGKISGGVDAVARILELYKTVCPDLKGMATKKVGSVTYYCPTYHTPEYHTRYSEDKWRPMSALECNVIFGRVDAVVRKDMDAMAKLI